MLKPLNQLPPGAELLIRKKKMGLFEYVHGEDAYLTYQMKGALGTQAVLESEDASWTFQAANWRGGSYVVKDRTGNVVTTSPWPLFKKASVVLADGRVLRLVNAKGLMMLDAGGNLVVMSQERGDGLLRVQNHIVLGPDARSYPELPFLIGFCRFLMARAVSEQGQMGLLSEAFNTGLGRFE